MTLGESEVAVDWAGALLWRSLGGFSRAWGKKDREKELITRAIPEAKEQVLTRDGSAGAAHTGRAGPACIRNTVEISWYFLKILHETGSKQRHRDAMLLQSFYWRRKNTTTVDFMPLPKIRNRSDALRGSSSLRRVSHLTPFKTRLVQPEAARLIKTSAAWIQSWARTNGSSLFTLVKTSKHG